MYLFNALLFFFTFSASHGTDIPHPTLTTPPSSIPDEDQQIINETIAKYGPPENYALLGLPGPELLADEDRFNHRNHFKSKQEEGSYSLTIRTITDYFSYNGRYENSTLKKIGLTEIPVVKGQFGEHFERKSGGFYIRTIGYVLDENGYRQFLMDLSTAETNVTIPETTSEPIFIVVPVPVDPGDPESSTVLVSFPAHSVGGPGAGKGGISSTALGTLIGGNSLG